MSQVGRQHTVQHTAETAKQASEHQRLFKLLRKRGSWSDEDVDFVRRVTAEKHDNQFTPAHMKRQALARLEAVWGQRGNGNDVGHVGHGQLVERLRSEIDRLNADLGEKGNGGENTDVSTLQRQIYKLEEEIKSLRDRGARGGGGGDDDEDENKTAYTKDRINRFADVLNQRVVTDKAKLDTLEKAALLSDDDLLKEFRLHTTVIITEDHDQAKKRAMLFQLLGVDEAAGEPAAGESAAGEPAAGEQEGVVDPAPGTPTADQKQESPRDLVLRILGITSFDGATDAPVPDKAWNAVYEVSTTLASGIGEMMGQPSNVRLRKLEIAQTRNQAAIESAKQAKEVSERQSKTKQDNVRRNSVVYDKLGPFWKAVHNLDEASNVNSELEKAVRRLKWTKEVALIALGVDENGKFDTNSIGDATWQSGLSAGSAERPRLTENEVDSSTATPPTPPPTHHPRRHKQSDPSCRPAATLCRCDRSHMSSTTVTADGSRRWLRNFWTACGGAFIRLPFQRKTVR